MVEFKALWKRQKNTITAKPHPIEHGVFRIPQWVSPLLINRIIKSNTRCRIFSISNKTPLRGFLYVKFFHEPDLICWCFNAKNPKYFFYFYFNFNFTTAFRMIWKRGRDHFCKKNSYGLQVIIPWPRKWPHPLGYSQCTLFATEWGLKVINLLIKQMLKSLFNQNW